MTRATHQPTFGHTYALAASNQPLLAAVMKSGVDRHRNKVERLIGRVKEFRRIATRYEKRALNYAAMLTIAAIFLWSQGFAYTP